MKRLILNIWLALPIIILAQQLNFEYYSVKDGLVQSRVKSIVQDSKGYLWLATNGGVSRFEGSDFVNFTTKEGLVNNRSTGILEAKDGSIWITTLFGVSRITFGKYSSNFKIENLDSKKGLASNAVFSVCQISDSIFWLGTAKGINEVIVDDQKSGSKIAVTRVISRKQGLRNNSVSEIIKDQSGNIWISYTGSGISMYNSVKKEFKHFDRSNGLSSNTINDLFVDEKNKIWCATGRGISVLKRNEIGEFEISVTDYIPELSGTNIRSITQNFRGEIVAASSKLYRLKMNDMYLKGDRDLQLLEVIDKQRGFEEIAVECLFEDKEKNLWIGTFNGGLIKFKYSGFDAMDISIGLSSARIQTFFQDDNGLIYLGTNKFVDVLNLKGDKVDSIYHIGPVSNGITIPQSYWSIHKDSRGHLWMGSTEGLVEIGGGRTFVHSISNGLAHNFVLDIHEDIQGNLWFATFGGLSYLSSEGSGGASLKQFKTFRVKDGLPHNQVRSICEDSKGNLFFATRRGLVKYDGYTFKTFGQESGLDNDFIFSVKCDSKNNIWLVTASGVALFEGKTFKNFNTKNGLNSDTPYFLELAKNGKVWIGTNKGLNVLSLNEQYEIQHIEYYGIDQSVLNGELNQNAVFKDDHGRLWFGSQKGVIRYNDELRYAHNIASQINIQNIRIFLKNHEIPRNHEYEWDQNHFTFDYGAISFSGSDDMQYQYMVEGLDDQWFPWSSVRSATWSNIPPGNYIFKVRSRNSAGMVNNEPVEFSFKVVPPFWKTLGFQIGVLLLIGSLVFFTLRYRLKQLEKSRILLKQKVAERTQEINEKNKELQNEQKRTKKILEELRLRDKDITDSLKYAKRIQEAIMPPNDYVRSVLPSSFVYYRPKGIVSGDFYWVHEEGDDIYIAVVDCTGHGVPGALMSIVGFKLLVQAVGLKALNKPSEILFEMNQGVRTTLRQTVDEDSVKDGMDVALMKYNRKTKKGEFAGAFNPLYQVRNGELNVFRGNRFPIGIFDGKQIKYFDNHEFQVEPGDSFYMFSDGYADQFGGPNNKKFKYKPFRQLLLDGSSMTFHEQEKKLHSTMIDWRGPNEQIDDICVMGFSFD